MLGAANFRNRIRRRTIRRRFTRAIMRVHRLLRCEAHSEVILAPQGLLDGTFLVAAPAPVRLVRLARRVR